MIFQTLDALKKQGRVAFVPYLTAGDPSLAATELFVRTLATVGADIIELGVPFSDPMADGPVNQRAAERALRNGVSLSDVLELVSRLRKDGITVPIVIFTYFNPILAMGVTDFARAAKSAGASGALVVDLPPEESEEYRKVMQEAGVETIFLAAPTTEPSRLRFISENSTGCLYYVSRTGVTGAQAELPATLSEELAGVRKNSAKPFIVGFGISTPEQARVLANSADGIVVGSAIVKLIEENADPAKAAKKIEGLAKAIVEAIRVKQKAP